MPVHNEDVAQIFERIASLLEIEGDNPFRIRAYRNAARTVRGLSSEVSTLVQNGEDLSRLPGIGKTLAAKIGEIVDTGSLAALTRLQQQVPASVTDLLRLPGLGPKRVALLYHELGVQTLDQLHRACKDGRLCHLSGFGSKTEQRIRKAIESAVTTGRRYKLARVVPYAESLEQYLKETPGVEQAVIAGSYRRCKETVGDLDILVAAAQTRPVIERLAAYAEVDEILSRGKTRSSVVLKSGIQVDLRVVARSSFGAALHYFTGSKAHNIAIRKLGQKHGLKINEYGVFRDARRIAGETEASVFAAVGLPEIPPELRENQGEIEAAQQSALPELIRLEDLQGDLHAHSSASDGHNTILEMASAAARLGLMYIAITEHSKRLTVTHGLDSRRLRQQIEEIDALNEKLTGIRVLKGIEVDILEDGNLDLPDDVLRRLDVVVGAVHSKFHLSRARQTERILRAMDHPHFHILAHPSGRLIEEREPYDVDMPRIIRRAQSRGCFLELNAHPERLDLLDNYCRAAREEGVLISVNSDAHRVTDFKLLRYGVGQARRGWLEKKDVLNARPLPELRKLLRRGR